MNADEPEVDPVGTVIFSDTVLNDQRFPQNVPNWDQYTIVGTSQEIFKDYLRLTSVRVVFSLS